MKIYEIDEAIEKLIAESVDEETGELLVDEEKLNALQMKRDEAVENLALYYKNLIAESKAIKAEEDALKKRRESTVKAAERAVKYLEYALHGENFKTARVKIGYRKSEKVEVSDSFVAWAMKNSPDFLRYKEPEADKTAIKAAIKDGVKLDGAEIVTNINMQII